MGLFCFIAKQNSYPKLSSNAIMKLRHLSIVSLASKCRTISYRTLCEHLGIDNIRELEDLIIEAFYADVIKGSSSFSENQFSFYAPYFSAYIKRQTGPNEQPTRDRFRHWSRRHRQEYRRDTRRSR